MDKITNNLTYKVKLNRSILIDDEYGKYSLFNYKYSITQSVANIFNKVLKQNNEDKDIIKENWKKSIEELSEKFMQENNLNLKAYDLIFMDETSSENFILSEVDYVKELYAFKQRRDFGILEKGDEQYIKEQEGDFSDSSKEYDEWQHDLKRKLQTKSQKFKDFGGDEIIYIGNEGKYFDVEEKIFHSAAELARFYRISPHKVKELHDSNDLILNYKKLDYTLGNQNGKYGLIKEDDIVSTKYYKKDKKYKITTGFNKLINNLGNNDKEQIDYIHKSVLWKIFNINSANIPSVVFFGPQGAGKGLFCGPFSKSIFSYKNVQDNINQSKITNNFGFDAEALIAEFAEVISHNTHEDIKTANVLKNYILADNIKVNKKGIQEYEVKNKTWFIISSNSPRPLMLEGGTNRRYTTIKTGPTLTSEDTDLILNDVKDPIKVLNYVHWLIQEYKSDLPTRIIPLENEDKEELISRSKNDIDMFWDYIKDIFKDRDGEKIKSADIIDQLREYCMDNGLEEKEMKKHVWKQSPFTKKGIRIGNKTYQGINFTLNNK